jgi:hypothetical protein
MGALFDHQPSDLKFRRKPGEAGASKDGKRLHGGSETLQGIQSPQALQNEVGNGGKFDWDTLEAPEATEVNRLQGGAGFQHGQLRDSPQAEKLELRQRRQNRECGTPV